MDTPLINVKNDDLSFAIYKIKKAVKLVSAEILWDNGKRYLLSHDDRIAAAKKKADKYNQNRASIVPSKLKKCHEPEMT